MYIYESVGSSGVEEIAEYHANGTFFRAITGIGVYSNIYQELALGPNGQIYLDNVSSYGGLVRVYAPKAHGDATPIREFDQIASYTYGPNLGLTLDASNNLYGRIGHNPNEVGVWAPNAQATDPPTRVIIDTAYGYDPWAEAVDSSGHLWVLTRPSNNSTILEYASNASGNATPIQMFSTGLTDSTHLRIDKHGRPWIDFDGNNNERCVERFSTTGTPEVSACDPYDYEYGEQGFAIKGNTVYMTVDQLHCPVSCFDDFLVEEFTLNGTYLRAIDIGTSQPPSGSVGSIGDIVVR